MCGHPRKPGEITLQEWRGNLYSIVYAKPGHCAGLLRFLNEPASDKESAAHVQRAVAADDDSVAVRDFTVQLPLARSTLLCTQAALA